MQINSIGRNPQCNCTSNKKYSAPAFGAIRFTEEGIKLLKSQLVNKCGENVDLFVKEVKPLITRAENNPIHVIVDRNADTADKLYAKVEDRKLKNFGYDASTIYPQDDKYSYDFVATAADKAEHLNKLNTELDGIPVSEM